MAKGRGKTPSRKRGEEGALANKRAADRHATALAPIIREIRRAGYTTLRDMSEELNRMNVPTVRGGRWQPMTVARVLARLR
jgi:hypothetical protein